MTSKERVLAAVRRQPTDRLPRYFWVGKGAADNLCKEFGIQYDQIDSFMGNDVRQTWLSINGQMEQDCAEGQSFVDEWGITWSREGYYNTVVINPMAELSENEIAEYSFPDPYAPARYEKFDHLVKEFGGEYFVGADISGSLFEPAYHLRGMENILIDMAMESPEADILLDRLCEFTSKVAVEAVRRGADGIWLGDDLGSQRALLMPPDMWRKYFKPRMKKIIDAIRAEKSDMIVAYHSCGSIASVIGDLAEVGINVLNPLQESADGIDHIQIKQQYGDKLSFMCGLDTQTFLMTASPKEVIKAMTAKAAALSEGGGYIAAVSHTLQHDVPAINIKAIIDALTD